MHEKKSTFTRVSSAVARSLVVLAAYRFFSTTTRTPLPVNSATVETTTPEQRARGEASFQTVTRAEQVTVAVPRWVMLYVVVGYVVLGVALIVALIAHFCGVRRKQSV